VELLLLLLLLPPPPPPKGKGKGEVVPVLFNLAQRHEGVLGSGGIVPRILDRTRCR